MRTLRIAAAALALLLSVAAGAENFLVIPTKPPSTDTFFDDTGINDEGSDYDTYQEPTTFYVPTDTAPSISEYMDSYFVDASSHYTNKSTSRSVAEYCAADGDFTTAWNANSKTVGEWIRLTTRDGCAYTISGFAIANGYWRTNEAYRNNPRPRTVDVYADEVYVMTANLEDRKDVMQYVSFPAPVVASGIKLVISDVYKGAKYKDTAITEILLY